MKIAVLVSGGVDSSVALRLLQQQGHDITAFYLKIWLEDELAYLGTCPWEEDLAYVRAVCEQANVPLKVISLQKEYWDEVVSYTISEVKAGRTPNPDILCNQQVKFGAFYRCIDDSFDKVATGHYAQVKEIDGKFKLICAPDIIKDQTYFLSHLTQKQLSRVLFPIGHLTKPEVRELAQSFDIPNKNRKDSQGICFLGKLKFNDFIRHHVGDQEGPLLEFESGRKVGTHKGFWYYTIGQRQGIGLSGGPWYVVAKNIQENIVYISRCYYDAEKQRNSFVVRDCNWITECPSDGIMHIKIRHGAQKYEGSLKKLPDGAALINLSENDQGIASGQFAVFYLNDECLGSGTII